MAWTQCCFENNILKYISWTKDLCICSPMINWTDQIECAKFYFQSLICGEDMIPYFTIQLHRMGHEQHLNVKWISMDGQWIGHDANKCYLYLEPQLSSFGFWVCLWLVISWFRKIKYLLSVSFFQVKSLFILQKIFLKWNMLWASWIKNWWWILLQHQGFK